MGSGIYICCVKAIVLSWDHGGLFGFGGRLHGVGLASPHDLLVGSRRSRPIHLKNNMLGRNGQQARETIRVLEKRKRAGRLEYMCAQKPKTGRKTGVYARSETENGQG